MKFRTNILIIAILSIAVNTYSQIDSIENRKIYSWKLNSYDLSLELEDIDTSLVSFQNFNPLLRKTISANFLGNLGTAVQSKVYFDRRKYETGFIFSEPYGIYFHLPKEQIYYNTKRQFTLFNYSNAGPKEESEQVLGVLHTQNVSKDFNFGFDYDLISSDGRYLNQEVKQNKITLFTSYQNKGYRVHANFNLNKVKAQENGGIDSLHYLGDDDYKKRRNIPVKLDGARNEVSNSGFYLAQEYRFGKKVQEVKVKEKPSNKLGKSSRNTVKGIKGKAVDDNPVLNDVTDTLALGDIHTMQGDSLLKDSTLSDTTFIVSKAIADSISNYDYDTTTVFKMSGFSFSHEMIYNSDTRKFFDDRIDEDFYINKDIFIDSAKTHDEVRQKQFGNKLSMNYKYSDKLSIRFSFYNEQMDYIYNDTTVINTESGDSIVPTNIEEKYSNSNVSFYIKALLFDQIYFSGYGEYYFTGYKSENSKIDLKFAYILKKNTEISLEGTYANQRPDYFYENFTSNNFSWNNDYLRRIEEWDAGFSVRNRKYKLYANVRYGQISNHLYLDTTAYVNQYRDQVNILSGELSKTFKLGPINSVTRFVYQKSTEDSVLNLPEYNLYQSLYLEYLWNFKATGGKLLWQFGVDYRYASSYIADGYMPTTGLFYRQYDHEQPDYNCVDVFINIKIKRARFYLKYHFLNSAISEKYYFTGPYYPSPEPLLKFGLAWTFYD